MIDELGNWRPKRNMFSQEYFDVYHAHMPRSEPAEDYDDRNALYALYCTPAHLPKNSKIPCSVQRMVSDLLVFIS